MNKEKVISSLDWLAILSMKIYILFQVLHMLLTAISIRNIEYRILPVLIDGVTIAIAIHFLKRMKTNNSNPADYFTKQVLIREVKIISRIYIKFVMYMIIVLLILSRIITYN